MATVSDNATCLTGNYYDHLGDSRGVATFMQYGKSITLNSGDEIRDTANHDYDIVVEGKAGTSIVLYNTLDYALTVTVFMQPVSALSQYATIYTESAVLAASGNVLVIAPGTGGTGAADYKAVPALAGPAYKFILRVAAGTTPTSGNLAAYAYTS